jgi:hypothetical protein
MTCFRSDWQIPGLFVMAASWACQAQEMLCLSPFSRLNEIDFEDIIVLQKSNKLHHNPDETAPFER